MRKLISFFRMAQSLYGKFFLAEDERDAFPVIELGPFNGTDETYSLVYLSVGDHPQHIHDSSDAQFFFHSGQGVIIVGDEKREIPFKAGDTVEIVQGAPHGFRVTQPGIFLVWQAKAITNLVTGERDVRYADEPLVFSIAKTGTS